MIRHNHRAAAKLPSNSGSHFFPGKQKADRVGFSLIEVLVVLAIIAILAALSAPSLNSLLRASSLSEGGRNLMGQLSFARQSAITQNQAMEFRIYQYADPTFPGETAGSPASGKYRAVQIFEMTAAGTAIPWSKMEKLPAGIIVDSGATLSSLLTTSSPNSTKKTWTTSDPQIPLPGIGTGYNCNAFRLRPDGTTNLSSSPPSPPDTWCLTLHSIQFGDALATPPTNFVTIQVDPVAGKISMFRP